MGEKRPADHDPSAGRGAPGSPRVGVVLAAGRSERLRPLTRGRSKLLFHIGGLTLVERAVKSLLAAGVDRVVVVVGHQAEAIGDAALEVSPGRVEVVRAERWEAGNGASLAAAEPALAGEPSFVVVCGDHVFGAGALEALARSNAPAVLVDSDPDPDAWAEGTRVRVDLGSARAFGKELDEPAIDCGAFVLTPEVFDCQRAASAAGDESLAGAVTRLAERRPLDAVPIPEGGWWQDVDTPRDVRGVKRRVRRSLGRESDGPVSRYLNRPVSTHLTMALSPLRLSPALLSFAAFLCGMLAAVFLAAGHYVVGGLLVHGASVLDGVDGETARLQMRATPRGAWLNGLLSRTVDAAIVAGLAAPTLEDVFTPRVVLVVGSVGLAWALVAMASNGWTTLLRLPATRERLLGLSLGRRDGRLFLVTAWALLGHPVVAIVAALVAWSISVIARLVLVRRSLGLEASA